jgi:hypothetical protein
MTAGSKNPRATMARVAFQVQMANEKKNKREIVQTASPNAHNPLILYIKNEK